MMWLIFRLKILCMFQVHHIVRGALGRYFGDSFYMDQFLVIYMDPLKLNICPQIF